MASRACDILVSTPKGKYRLVVIEERRPPLIAVVAGRAIVAACSKLVGVRIGVAFAASLGRALELNMHHIQLHVRRLVTLCAGYGAMGAYKWKVGLGMVEFRKIVPAYGGVADLTA